MFMISNVAAVLCVLLSDHTILVPSRPAMPPPRTASSVAGRIPGAIGWNLRVLWLDPKFARECSASVDKARKALKPGETRVVSCIYRETTIVGGERVRVFVGLGKAGASLLDPAHRQTPPIEISRVLEVLCPPLPLDARTFAKAQKEKVFGPEVSYKDHVYSTNILAHLRGFSSVKKGAEHFLTSCRFEDLRNQAIRAPHDAVVILLSRDDSKVYNVFDPVTGNKDPRDYKKGRKLEKSGNTVYLSVRPSKTIEYVVALRHLPDISVSGGKLQVGSTISKLGSGVRPVHLEIHRVLKPAGRYLAGKEGRDRRVILSLDGVPFIR